MGDWPSDRTMIFAGYFLTLILMFMLLMEFLPRLKDIQEQLDRIEKKLEVKNEVRTKPATAR